MCYLFIWRYLSWVILLLLPQWWTYYERMMNVWWTYDDRMMNDERMVKRMTNIYIYIYIILWHTCQLYFRPTCWTSDVERMMDVWWTYDERMVNVRPYDEHMTNIWWTYEWYDDRMMNDGTYVKTYDGMTNICLKRYDVKTYDHMILRHTADRVFFFTPTTGRGPVWRMIYDRHTGRSRSKKKYPEKSNLKKGLILKVNLKIQVKHHFIRKLPKKI